MEEKIEKRLEKMKKNDTGFFVLLCSHSIWIIATIFAIALFVKEVQTIAAINQGISIPMYFVLLAKAFLIIFSALVFKDILMMFYEIHFMIKHKHFMKD